MLALINLSFSKSLKCFKNQKLKKLGGRVLAPRCPPWRRNQTPAAAPHGGRDLTPWDTAAGACHHGIRRQEPAVVGYGARFTFVENFDWTIYFSKIMTN
jgi:hypothetical protein